MPDSVKDVIPFVKRRGETPAQALLRLREERPELAHAKLSYAGRLDPMADGLLLVLAGDANKRREEYLALPKTYRVSVLFGFRTDSHDILGKLEASSEKRVPMASLIEPIAKLVGAHDQYYPPFSSKPISGRALFEWARAGKLAEIEIPTHPVEIYDVKLLKTRTITGDALAEYIETALKPVKGDFRQNEIRACWDYNLRATYTHTYDVIDLEVDCSSGTYMRMLAHELGETLGVPALALSITRTKIGGYELAAQNEGLGAS